MRMVFLSLAHDNRNLALHPIRNVLFFRITRDVREPTRGQKVPIIRESNSNLLKVATTLNTLDEYKMTAVKKGKGNRRENRL